MPNPHEAIPAIAIGVNQHYTLDIPGRTLTAHEGATQKPIHHFTVAIIGDCEMQCRVSNHLGDAIDIFAEMFRRFCGAIHQNADIALLAVFSEDGLKTSDYDIVAVFDLSGQAARATPLEVTP